MAEQQSDTVAAWQQAVTRTVVGTGRLGGRRLRWIWETEAGRARLGQIVARTIGTAFLVYTFIRFGTYWPWVGVAEIVGVLWYGYAKAQLEEEQLAEDGDEPEPEEPTAPAASMPAAPDVRRLIIDSVRHLAGQRQGVHLEQLHAYWSLHGDLGMDLSEFRRWVEAHGVPVRNSLKASGTTRIGIHLADLPTEAAATPPPLVPDDLFQDW